MAIRLRLEEFHLFPEYGAVDIIIRLPIANAMDTVNSIGNKGITEEMGTRVTGVMAPPSNAVPLGDRGTDTACPVLGGVAMVRVNGMGLILMSMMVNSVAAGPTDPKVASDRVSLSLPPHMTEGVVERGWGGFRSPPRLSVMDPRAPTMGISTALNRTLPRLPDHPAATGTLADPLAIGLVANAAGSLMASAASASGAPTARPPGRSGALRRRGFTYLTSESAAAGTSWRPPTRTMRTTCSSPCRSRPTSPRCTPAAAIRPTSPPPRELEGGAIRLGRLTMRRQQGARAIPPEEAG